ncbi:MAG: hypothetical protein FJ278_24435 [Planctomycetes bacterium]|nr:hypothetical protein [Planctomycetota bacterium]
MRGKGVNVAALGLGFLALAMPLWLYNWATFGNLLGAHVKCNIEFYAEPASGLLGTVVCLLAHPGIGDEVKNLWIMSPFLAFFALACAPRFAPQPSLLCVCVLLMIVPSVVLALSGHFKEGLLAVTPATAYAFLRLQDLWRPAADEGVRKLRFAFCLVALYVVLVAAASPVTGGLQHGPRFLLPIVPLVMILAMSGGEQLLERGYSPQVQKCLLAGFLVLAACGLTMAIRACNAAYFRKQLGHNLVAKVREYPQKVVIADHWPTPQELAALYYEKMLFLAKDQPSAVKLIEQLAAKDIREFVYLSHEAAKVGAVPRTLGPARMKVSTEERLPAVGLVVAVYEMRT